MDWKTTVNYEFGNASSTSYLLPPILRPPLRHQNLTTAVTSIIRVSPVKLHNGTLVIRVARYPSLLSLPSPLPLTQCILRWIYADEK